MSHLALGSPLNDVAAAFLRTPHSQSRGSTLQRRREDRQFQVMEQAFRASGGLASGNDVVRVLRQSSDQPISVLARWIVAREAVSFEWHSCTLLPLFQFDFPNARLRPLLPDIVHELTAVFDDWDLSLWFAQANSWLGDRSPVSVMASDSRAVLDAARADRFVARG